MISRTFSHTVLALIVFIWVVPFIALVTTSLRSEIASKTSGFWTAFTPTELGHRFSTHDKGLNVELIELKGNIFDRLNKDDKSFPVSGEVTSIFIKSRIPDPENPGKTKLVRKLVPPGELMTVRKGNLIFKSNGDFTWTFPTETVPKPKNTDAARWNATNTNAANTNAANSNAVVSERRTPTLHTETTVPTTQTQTRPAGLLQP